MKALDWVGDPKYRLDVVAGFCDGILTALTIAAGKMLATKSSLNAGLAFRIAAAAAISGAFIFFVAHYAELRGELFEAEKQLNLLSHGRLAKTRLGRTVLYESALGALIASVCSFCGAMFPMGVGVLIPIAPWIGIVAALMALALLGVFLALTVHGSAFRWATGLLVSGAILAWIGTELRVI